jgi:hypothetical protein
MNKYDSLDVEKYFDGLFSVCRDEEEKTSIYMLIDAMLDYCYDKSTGFLERNGL